MIRLFELLERYARADGLGDAGDELRRIEAAIWDEYGVEETVFVLDMAGFSRLVQRHGLVHYLSMVQRMRRVAEPLLGRHRGRLVKFEADNCFARFAAPEDAIAAGIAINRAIAELNLVTAEVFDVHVGIGIDVGEFLLLREGDFFGDPVNLASKLGEDIAGPGEILVTDRAMGAVSRRRYRAEPVSFSVSGLRLDAHRILYDTAAPPGRSVSPGGRSGDT